MCRVEGADARMTVAGRQIGKPATTLDEGRQTHRWAAPTAYNIAEDCLGTWASRSKTKNLPAIIADTGVGATVSYSWRQVYEYTVRFAVALRGKYGVKPGDVVAVIGGQGVETAVAHMAIYYLGAVALPIAKVMSITGIQFRLQHANVVAAIIPSDIADGLAESSDALHGIGVVLIDVDDSPAGFWSLVNAANTMGFAEITSRRTPAVLLYSSGTTGAPKGCLHGHQLALAHANMSYLCDYFRLGDVFYSTADWAWVAGLGSGLLGPWGCGVPVLVSSRPFTPDYVADLIRRNNVTTSLLPPTVIRHLKAADVDLGAGKLRALVSGGEAVTGELWEWATARLTRSFSSGYGQSEANLTIGTAGRWGSSPSLGQPLPGHNVVVLDESNTPTATDGVGEIALQITKANPAIMLGYLSDSAATAARLSAGWLHTGDVGRVDDEGNIWLLGRADDVIKASGYRIGPDEVESAILKDAAVVGCVAVGLPDTLRGQVVAVVVQLHADAQQSEALNERLCGRVKADVGHHAYPRRFVYVDQIPRSDVGKVSRGAIRRQLMSDAAQAPSTSSSLDR